MEVQTQHNAELGALVYALREPDKANEVAAVFRPDDFLNAAHKAGFLAIPDLCSVPRAFDLLDGAVRATDVYCRYVWDMHALERDGKAPTLDNFRDYLLDARRTKTIRQANLALTDAINEPGADLVAALETFNAACAAADEGGTRADGCADAMSAAHAEYLATDEGGPNALRTGFRELDQALNGGFRPGAMYVLASRPGIGKSALALHFAGKLASADHAVAYVSLEMSASDCAARLLTAASGVQRPYKRGFLNTEAKRKLRESAEALRHLPVTFMDAHEATLGAIRSRLARLARRPALLVIDYLQLLSCPGHEVRAVEVGAISRSLKQLALQQDLPVLALSQLNRGMEQQNREPRLSDLRESGSIEQDADAVMLMHRLKVSDDGKTEDVQVALRKNRNGPHAKVTLEFRKPFGRFACEGKVGAEVETGGDGNYF